MNKNPKLEKRNLSDLDVDDFKDFKEEYYLNRKYDKTNVDKGKLFFKYRYLKHKYTQINETIQRLSVPNYQPYSNIDNDNGRISHKQAMDKANAEYEIFNKTQPIESDFDKAVKKMLKEQN